jgi:hypothetical protein
MVEEYQKVYGRKLKRLELKESLSRLQYWAYTRFIVAATDVNSGMPSSCQKRIWQAS